VTRKRSGNKATTVGAPKRGKPEVKRELKDLDVRKAKGVRGGGKHLAGVKYEDITVNP
jgi:hypothetical protein